MRYCSIDIETTGLNPDTCDILQFAAVLDDLNDPKPLVDLPRFTTYFYKDEPICGEPYALGMHGQIFKKIAEAQRNGIEFDDRTGERYMKIESLPHALSVFLMKNDWPTDKRNRLKVTVAGKNVAGFDLRFLKTKIKDWEQIFFLSRTFDPAVLYLDYKKDTELPDLKTCMERANIAGEVAHTALEDALTVVKLIRYKMIKKTK